MKRMYWFFIVIVIVAVIVGVWWFRGKNAPMRQGELRVGSNTYKVEIADTIPLRTQGLSGREKLEAGSGVFFIFSAPGKHPFWMKDMHFPLDFVWINGDTVVGTTENVVPSVPSESSLFSLPLYYSPEPADKVLELNAGEVEKGKIKIGDRVELRTKN